MGEASQWHAVPSARVPQRERAGKAGPCVLQLTPALNEGGVERGTLEIASALLKTGRRALIATSGGRMESRLLNMGAEIFHLPLDSKNPVTLRRNASKLATLIRSEGVDIVHARSRAPAWSGLWAAETTGTRFITTYHGAYNEELPLKRRYNAVMAKGDPVIAVSEFISRLVQERHGVPRERITVIPRGADLELFSEDGVSGQRIAQLAGQWRIDDELRTVFMLPGRLTRWKGQEVFIDAAAILRQRRGPCFLAIMVGGAGEGDAYPVSLEERIQKAGCHDCVMMAGPCSDMPAAYLLASCVVSASTDPEAFGRVAVEAQAMGRPVIATDHGGAQETVAHGKTGLLVPPGKAEALADAMEDFLDLSPVDKAAIGASAVEHARAHYSIERMQAATLAVYEQAFAPTQEPQRNFSRSW